MWGLWLVVGLSAWFSVGFSTWHVHQNSVNPAATQVGQNRGKFGESSAFGLHVAPIDPPVLAAQSPSTENSGV